MTYVATSGITWRALHVRWQIPAPVRVHLGHSLRRYGRRARLLLTVSVYNIHGLPVRGMPVSLTLIRPQHPTPMPIVKTTTRAGTVRLSLTASPGGMLTVIATTNYGASQTETVFHNV
jgi:hypothetical protein